MMIDKEPVLRSTFLVVEDEENIRELIVEALTCAEFTIFSAANATEAIQLVNSINKFDVLFTDVRFPDEMDGLQLAEKFMQEGRCKAVIYATGYSFDPPRMTSPSIIFRKPYLIPSIRAAAKQMSEVARLM